jgi:hypothetical protein
MARKATGQVVERKRKRGRVFALRFRAGGERQYVTLPDGTSRDEAESCDTSWRTLSGAPGGHRSRHRR